MARALLIANPGAARTHSGVVRQIERVFNTAGWQVETLATVGPGDARKLAQYGLEQSVDVVAVLGGDGTIMQVAAALVGTQVPMGVLPGGTGNQLAGNLRLSFNPVRAAAALIRGTPRAFDLGRLDRPDGAHYFAVGGGAGLDAKVMASGGGVSSPTSRPRSACWRMWSASHFTLKPTGWATISRRR